MARKDGSPGRIRQLVDAYRMTRKADPAIGWVLLAALLAPVLVGVGIGLLLDQWLLLGILGLGIGFLVASFVFGRRAERAAYTQIEGQPGAAVAAMNLLRKGWTVTPAVAVSKSQDVVHRAVGRPGIVLVGEGNPTRVKHLLLNEKRKEQRVAPDAPVTELVVGRGEGEVPLRKLNSKIMKLPRTITPAQVDEINSRLRALQSQQGTLPIPKGPLPRNARMPKGMPR